MAKTNQIKDGCSQQKAEMGYSSAIQSYITLITSNACSYWKLPIIKNKSFTYDWGVLYIL